MRAGMLSKMDGEIIRAVAKLRYVTSEDVTALFYSPGSATRVRDILAQLSGGADLVPDAYLYRFPLPDTKGGNPKRVYTLGLRGREGGDLLAVESKRCEHG